MEQWMKGLVVLRIVALVTVDGKVPVPGLFPYRGLGLYRDSHVPSYVPCDPFVPSLPLFPKRRQGDDKEPVTRG